MKKRLYILALIIAVTFVTSCNTFRKNEENTNPYIHEISKQALYEGHVLDHTGSLSATGLSFYEQNEDILLEVGFGETSSAPIRDTEYALLEIRDINPEVSPTVKKEDSKVKINGSAAEYIRIYGSAEVKNIHCEELGKIVYYEDVVINMSQAETDTLGEIKIVITWADYVEGPYKFRELIMYYYIGENGVGCSFTSKSDARKSYEKATNKGKNNSIDNTGEITMQDQVFMAVSGCCDSFYSHSENIVLQLGLGDYATQVFKDSYLLMVAEYEDISDITPKENSKVINSFIDKSITREQVAELLSLSSRQISRLKKSSNLVLNL